MTKLSVLLALWILLAVAPIQASETVEVAIITSHPAAYQAGLKQFTERFGSNRLALVLMSSEVDCTALARSKAVYVEGGFWSASMVACTARAQEMATQGVPFMCTMPQLLQANWQLTPSPRLAEASAYLNAGGAENMLGFLAILYNAAGGKPAIPPPALLESAATGIYHPKAEQPFASLEEYLDWYRVRFPERANGHRVGILFFKSSLERGGTNAVDALVEALEQRRLLPVPTFGWPLSSVETLLAPGGNAAIEMLLLVDPVMPSPDNARFLEQYNLHAMNLMTTGATEEAWRNSESGLPPGRLPIQVGNAERSGVTEPILISVSAPKSRGGNPEPLTEQIELVAARAARWIALRSLPNRKKRLALVYYNNPPGKATLGASYLDVIPSLRNVLNRLSNEGYFTGDTLPDEQELKRLLMLSGRNIGEYAPGELEALVDDGHAILLPMTRYKEWFQHLPRPLQEGVLKTWGKPWESTLMTVSRDGQRYFVIPGIRLGNLLLAPQPLRAELKNADASTHDRKTPPPHSYLAAYLWFRYEWHADAIVHFGRHGTLEWLPGKDVAQQRSDPGTALIADLPHAYYYLVDGGGEFLQAKRRSNATMISHLTPMLAAAGLPKDYLPLRDALESFENTKESAPGVAAEHARIAWVEALRLKLDAQLEVSATGPQSEWMERLHDYLHDLEEQAIPLGLHRIGEMPSQGTLREAMMAYLLNAATAQTRSDFAKQSATWADSLMKGITPESPCAACQKALNEAADWLQELRKSPESELQSLIAVLNAGYIPSGVSGDPLRTPGSLRTGRNLHDQDPRGFPSKAAWAAGQRLAADLVAEHRRKHGETPKKVSFVLWYGESGRTQGLQESQALALLGVRPVWNGRGQVADVELMPLSELGRPRVDVLLTMSGLFRDGMPEKLELLDKAVRLVREAPEDNVIQAHTVAAESGLIASGATPENARKAARARLFGPQPGAFGVGMAGMMQASSDDGDPVAPALLYLRNMNYAYSADLQGEAIPDALKEQLKQNEVVIHGRSSNLYGALDADETYQFAGGLNAATTLASGRAPEYLFANARKQGDERYETAGKFVRRELVTRLWNEKWIQGMKDSGYAGAQQIATEVEHLYGFRATAPGEVDAGVWQETLDTYIHDKRNLGLEKWFREANPHARQMLAARLIEVDRQGVYRFNDSDKRALLSAYLRSVNEDGVSCYVNACGNRKLILYVASSARELDAVSARELRRYAGHLERANSPAPKDLDSLSDAVPHGSGTRARASHTMPDSIQGVKIFEIPLANIRVRTPKTAEGWAMLLLPLPFGVLLGFSRRRFVLSRSTTLRLER